MTEIINKSFKVLFLTPPYSVKQRYSSKVDIKKGYLPPLGLSYLSTIIEKYHSDVKVKVIDLQLYNFSKEKIFKLVEKFNPDLICFSALTPTVRNAFSIADYFKKRISTPVVFGGPHVSCFPEKTLKEQKSVDLVAVGEGDYTIIEIIDHYKGKKSLEKIKGLAYRNKKGKITKTPPREVIKDLDILPIPQRKFFNMKKYIPLPNQYTQLPVMNMITSRGCSYGKCTYCFEAGRLGHKYRRISVNRAIEEIKYLIKEYKIKEVSFWDDEFLFNHKWVNDFCDRLINEKINIKWSCYARVNFVTENILKKMARAGCWNIFYGIESGNQELLNKIRKGITLKQAQNAIKWTRKAGIESRGSFMLALPGETPKMAEKTIQFAIKLDLDYAQFLLTTPFPGTVLFEQCKNEGKLSLNYDDYSVFKPVFIPRGYKNKKEILKFQKRAYRKFYFRISYIIKHLKRIKSWTDIEKYLTGLKFIIGMG